jgi:hypothetical protein
MGRDRFRACDLDDSSGTDENASATPGATRKSSGRAALGAATAIRRPRPAISGRAIVVASDLRQHTERCLRLGYTKDEVTAHGFRASASSLLNESGRWHPDAIERQLGHIEGNDVRAAYARGEHWDERVSMMQWWADNLDGLRRAHIQVMETFGASPMKTLSNLGGSGWTS